MTQTVGEVLTPAPLATVDVGASVRDAAELMREHDVGDVLVLEDGKVVGIVTDRDLVVRVLAVGGEPTDPVGQVCSANPLTVSADRPVAEAAHVMAEHGVRRLPVVEDGRVVGIVSLGDLATEQDPGSVLGEISRAPGTR